MRFQYVVDTSAFKSALNIFGKEKVKELCFLSDDEIERILNKDTTLPLFTYIKVGLGLNLEIQNFIYFK